MVLRALGVTGAGRLARRVQRRLDWFTHGLTARELANIVRAGEEFARRREVISSWPVLLRIDISPLCNLHCTVCVHAEAHGHPALEKQEFHAPQRMSIEQFRRIVDEVQPWTCGVSLYYLGDPLVHPELDTMCGVARDAGLNVHCSTNLSFVLSEQRLRRIVGSGVTHLTVCVDGLSQELYGLTRVGGKIRLVLANLRQICRYREQTGMRRPQIEVQYIKYRRNLCELEKARRLFTDIGVDQVFELWGSLHNYTDRDPGNYSVFGPRKDHLLPRCHWPYFFAQIKYNGDVLPCCCHRLGQQYTRVDDPRCAGNVFETSVRDVWNSIEYQRARHLVSRPHSIESDASLSENFCAACPRLFDTDYDTATCRWGDKYAFEDLYSIDLRGRPARRRETRPTAVPVGVSGSGGSPSACVTPACCQPE